MKIALIANPDSGSGDADVLPDLMRELGADVEVFEIGDFDEAANSGAERIVVAGGDGSVGGAARAAGKAGLPLAVIPVGTANDFARAHELPLELQDACRLAVEGQDIRAIDIAAMNDRPWVDAVGVGLPSHTARHAKGMKHILGKLAYAAGAARAGFTAPSLRCSLTCDGEPWFEGDVWQLTVASSGAFGGGANVDARPDDGHLEVIVIEAGSRLRLAQHAYGLRIGKLESQVGVQSTKCRELKVSTPKRHGYNVDGDLVEVDNPTFTIDPGGVQLVCA